MQRSMMLVLLSGVLLALPLTAQARADAAMACVGAGMGQGSGMPMDHQAMRRMEVMDARLDSLAGVLRSSRGNRRLDAMAEVLGELVERQLQMRREMHQRMMQAEGGCGMPREGAGMRDCPMMRPDSTAAGGGHQMNH
ncbi:MAG: hypothetical protein IPL76_14680 [Gemmatimonadetes bacterium]|nr:hypothetical protein [Gemmatimonadota bacterium]